MSVQDPLLQASTFSEELEWISRYLPHQGTLQHFVHHNPLESFERYPFQEACQIGQALYQGRSFLDQDRYLAYLAEGKISEVALGVQLQKLMQSQNLQLSSAQQGQFLAFLQSPPHLSVPALIHKALEHSEHQRLIQHLIPLIASLPPESFDASDYVLPTYREWVKAQRGIDIDDFINPMLAKFLSSYVDPGCSYWQNEYREQGLWACFQENFKSTWLLENRLAKRIHLLLQDPIHRRASVPELILHYCSRLGLSSAQRPLYLLAMGLRLRGWASLFNQLSHDSEQILDHTLFSLDAFLLVKLVLEFSVCEMLGAEFSGESLTHYAQQQQIEAEQAHQTERLYMALHYLEQTQGHDVFLAASESVQHELVVKLSRLTLLNRLLLYQNALEQSYATQQIHALASAYQQPQSVFVPTHFQYITCIDDREESLRRYLEELDPACETFGVAGHFGLNMHFKGFNEVRYRKLCPGVVKETFKVTQIKSDAQPVQMSQGYATLFQTYARHSKISLFAACFTFLTGLLSAIPFFVKVFFPHWDLQLRRYLRKHYLHHTQLTDQIFKEEGFLEGLSYAEAADKVFQQLATINLRDHFCEIIYVVGHGSSSINNPHEYAYNCGACGGGKGRANARIFAILANHSEVRSQILQRHGLAIPETSVFIGGYHDTCKDNIVWFEPQLNRQQQDAHQHYKQVIAQALKHNAVERAKKFQGLSQDLGTDVLFEKVRTRSNDLTEARPEYNHATNALCVIGRRQLSRGLSFDRRAFLCSYHPRKDPEGNILAAIMGAAMPVCAGISLEYYFSAVDPEIYGCGSKLNHNITCNYGVMSGFASDLRLGLSRQMVEIHDPQRILFIIESQPAVVESIMHKNAQLARLIENQWVNLLVFDTEKGCFYRYDQHQFEALPDLLSAEHREREYV